MSLKRFWFVVRFLEIRLRFAAILVVTALLVGYWDHVQNYYERWQRGRMESTETAEQSSAHSGRREESVNEFFCPMHTFVIRDAPGKCPLCGMNLISRRKGEKQELPEGVVARVQTSPQRIVEAGVKVEPVGYQTLTRTVRAYGEVEADETRRTRVIARFGGRLEELMAGSTGASVAKGEPLARIYSPRFLAASEEYIQARKAQKRVANDPKATDEDKRRASELAALARQRLHLAGFSDEQLNALDESEKTEHSITLSAPFSGVVTERSAVQGDMVEDGTPLLTLVDLSIVWVQARVLETDLRVVRKDMPVRISTVADPGRDFFGTVDFVYPTLNPANRTAAVRIVVPNKDLALKPGMSVTVEFLGAVGKFEEVKKGAEAPVKTPAPAQDVYICPMHPEVVSGKPGKCPKCKMDLVKKPGDAAQILPGHADHEHWFCSMHPEVLSDHPGDCPKCGMKLEPKPASLDQEPWAEGYTCPMHPDRMQDNEGPCPWCDCGMKLTRHRRERVLAVPEEAVIDTGTRQIVYVESATGVYDAHTVTLGSRAGNFYPVLKGLNLGDRIVERGAFLIDAENRLNPQ